MILCVVQTLKVSLDGISCISSRYSVEGLHRSTAERERWLLRTTISYTSILSILSRIGTDGIEQLTASSASDVVCLQHANKLITILTVWQYL